MDDLKKDDDKQKMKELQVFKNRDFGEMRMLEIDGEAWFVGKDAAEILRYTNPQKSIERPC